MVTLKDIETYIRLKDYIEDNDVKIEDLFRSFNDKLIQVMVNCDGVSKKFYSLSSTANYMGVSFPAMKYAYFKRRDTIRKMKGEPKVFYVDWS